MDFAPTNKKNSETILKFKKTKLMPFSTQKFKKIQEPRLKVQIWNQPIDPRIATFDSLELKKLVCCEGIKLSNRLNKSVEKKNQKKFDRQVEITGKEGLKEGIKLCKASTSDSLSIDIKSLVFRNNRMSQKIMAKLNPEQLTHLRNIPRIARNDILISKKSKNQMHAFLKKENKTVILYEEIKGFTLVGSHPNLLQPQSLVSLDSGSYFIVDECDCQNLKNLVAQFGKIHPKMIVHYIKQVISALSHLRSFDQSHCRINMETILHNGQGAILVNLIKSSNKTPTEQDKAKYFHYLCPEVLFSNYSSFGEKVDVWAVGCLTLQLFSTAPKNNPLHPYNLKSNIHRNPSLIQTINKIHKLMPEQKMDKTQPFNPQRSNLKQEAQVLSVLSVQFIGKCLSINAHQRPTLKQLLCHPFLK